VNFRRHQILRVIADGLLKGQTVKYRRTIRAVPENKIEVELRQIVGAMDKGTRIVLLPRDVVIERDAGGMQGTRQVLIMCAPCGYKLRGTMFWLEQGIPDCPLCGEAMAIETHKQDGTKQKDGLNP
jgi:hypothetical protein